MVTMRAVLALASFLLSTAFIQIHDEAVIKGNGGATVRRTVASKDSADIEKLLEDLRQKEKDPAKAKQERTDAQKLRDSLCEAVTRGDELWDDCRWEGTTLIVQKHYGKNDSPFSSEDRGDVSFALHHFLGNAITRPPFPLLGVGPVMQDDEPHRKFIRDLQALGYELDLTIRMPGEIFYLWGTPVRNAGNRVTIDLLAPWPPDREETFIMSKGGLLQQGWFHFIVIFTLLAAAYLWWWRARSS